MLRSAWSLVQEAPLCAFYLPVSRKITISTSICISLHNNVGQSFGVSAKWEGVGEWGTEDACEHIAEECGCGLQPKAYVILMSP